MTALDIAHKDRAHSAVGGSTAKRVLNCTASVNHCAKYPNESNAFADMGTALHEAIDFIFQGKTKQDTDVIGLTFHKHLITEELFDEAIAPALAMWDVLEAEIGPIDYYNEKRVTFPGIDGAYGTVDIVGRGKDRSIVWDWKFGRGVAVTAEENEQLMYYAYAAAHSEHTSRFFDRDTPIEVFICQPLVGNGEPFTRWTTSLAQLDVFAMELKRAVEVSQTPEASFKIGSWCKFCNGKVGCPEFTGQVQILGRMPREELADEIARWMPYADLMLEWGQAVKEAAHKLLEDGASIPGYKLVAKRAVRSWTSEDKVREFLANSGVKPEEMIETKIISPAVAEKVLKKLGVKEIPNGLVDKSSSGTTLAPENDPRPALMSGVEALKKIASRI
jgi:hypothetical protein